MWSWNKSKGKTIKAPVDLDKPVENPDMIRAIERYYETSPIPQNVIVALMQALNKANYLVVYFDDDTNTTSMGNGVVRFEKDSVLAFPTCSDESGRRLLPLYSDWEQINLTFNRKVSTLVMPASHAWDWILNQNYEGAVINPSGLAFPLDLEQINDLVRQLQKH